MLRMCTLTFLLLLSLLGSVNAAPNIRMVAQSAQSSGVANVDFIGRIENTNSLATTLATKSPSFAGKHLEIDAAITRSKNDYRTFILRDRFGNERSLATVFDKEELSFEAGLNFSEGDHRLSVTRAQSFGPSPFGYSAVGVSYNYSLYNLSTRIGAEYSYTRQRQPESYFVDPRSYRTRGRPSSLTSQREELWIEQTLSEDMKFSFSGFRGRRFEDRPTHFGGELRSNYAATDSIFLRTNIGYLEEQEKEKLFTDRGYFSARWAEVELSYEPMLDLILSAGLGTVVEREDIYWGVNNTQVGTDTLALKGAYRHGRWAGSLSANFSHSNTSYRSRVFSGDVTCEF